MPLINFEMNLILNAQWIIIITNSTDMGKFTITDTKLYVLMVTQDNAKLLEQLKRGSKQTINCNK